MIALFMARIEEELFGYRITCAVYVHESASEPLALQPPAALLYSYSSMFLSISCSLLSIWLAASSFLRCLLP